jgi:hypothetical protein
LKLNRDLISSTTTKPTNQPTNKPTNQLTNQRNRQTDIYNKQTDEQAAKLTDQ